MIRVQSLKILLFAITVDMIRSRAGLPSFPPTPGFLYLGEWSSLTRSMAANRFPPPAAEMARSPDGKVSGSGEESKPSSDPNLNPVVARVRQLLINGASNEWDKCWEEGLTPWDLGQTTPIITHLVQTGKLPKGRILVPGCGTGYDVAAMASPECFVVGLDISSTVVNKAKEWSSSLPNAKCFTFLAEDFFTWTPAELFDVIFDYTFFCAIHPTMRPAWARKVNELLKPDGELIALMYLFDNQEGGPPYNTSVADYAEVLNSVGLTAISVVDNELAVKPRKGAEKLGRWKKSLDQSSSL